MISFARASEIVLTAARKGPREGIPLIQAQGRVLAADAFTDVDMPFFDNSAMDGYACRRADLAAPLKEIEVIPAGKMPQKAVGAGQCSRIMTGAPIPLGADVVVLFEHTRIVEGMVIVEEQTLRSNIRRQGEDLQKGHKVLSTGTFISPVEVAVLAGAGCDPVVVAKRPVVGVVATGDELVEPGSVPALAQIRNSNSYQLCAQVSRAGALPRYYGITGDSPNAVEHTLSKCISECNVVLFSGGVSMGDFDYVPRILKKKGIDIKFEKVAVKPGKPTVFGVKENVYFFGLPGNPVSTLVLFEVLVRPFLHKLMGSLWQPLTLSLPLGEDVKRKNAGRQEFRPVRFRDNCIYGLEYHGSAHIHAYTQAQGIITIPQGVPELVKGSLVEVRLI